MHSKDPIGPCNICGGKDFDYGPCERLSNTNRLPKCRKCDSLERHRIIRAIFSLMPADLIHGRSGLQFSRDMSVDHSPFASYVISEYGGENSLDIQSIDLPAGSFDWIISSHVINFVPNDKAALKEMARVAGPDGIIMLSVGGPTHRFGTTRYNQPAGPHKAFYIYGTDFADYLMEAVPECAVLELVAADPATATQDTVYLYAQNWLTLRRIAAVAAPKNIRARLSPARSHRFADAVAPAWDELARELARWRDAGRTPRIWLRDDDATTEHGKLSTLHGTCSSLDVPLCLAVIPAQCQKSLALWVADKPDVTVVQHGFDHNNHTPPDKAQRFGNSEFPGCISEKQAFQAIRTGKSILTKLFQERFLAVFVPPWGNCDSLVRNTLSELGFCGYSIAGKRGQPQRHGLCLANVHVALPQCAGDSWSVDEHDVLLRLAAALRELRGNSDDQEEPLGVNVHHKGMVPQDFSLLKEIVAFTRDKGAVWVDVRSALGLHN